MTDTAIAGARFAVLACLANTVTVAGTWHCKVFAATASGFTCVVCIFSRNTKFSAFGIVDVTEPRALLFNDTKEENR
jgi:hypothetical protein